MIKRLLIGLACLTMLAAIPAFAGAASVNLGVSASIANNCTIATSPVAFGAYDPVSTNASTPLDGSGSVSITCTKGAATTIGLGLGANPSGSTRRMTDGASGYLTYEAYQPPDNLAGTACSYTTLTVWGNAVGSFFTPAVAPDTNTRTYNVCGRVAAGQDQPAGGYNDTVLATVNF